MSDTPKNMAGIEPGQTWRKRAGSSLLDPNDPRGNPLPTLLDRRWLWRIEGTLAVTATTDAQRQLVAELYAYLAETCEHHMMHSDADESFPAHDQCLWCHEVVFKGDAANEVARTILGMDPS